MWEQFEKVVPEGRVGSQQMKEAAVASAEEETLAAAAAAAAAEKETAAAENAKVKYQCKHCNNIPRSEHEARMKEHLPNFKIWDDPAQSRLAKSAVCSNQGNSIAATKGIDSVKILCI